ncbi:MAG: TetR/AcrR family transcriptional regulator [Lachnospiraceae bacterium]|nr:TetR/AcrR family transcriptional regulator [Lachnospiraceae bacterium]
MIDGINRTTHYIRTDKAIVAAFCKILKFKPYETITIQNILDETPISRAAFYQHFPDKEAIAEQMMEEFMSLKNSIVQEMEDIQDSKYSQIVEKSLSINKDLILSLSKIHTPNVDLKQAIMENSINSYLKSSDSTYREIESQVYAQALSEFQLYTLKNESPADPGDPSFYNTVMINVFLKIMNWQNNQDIKAYLESNLPKD